jgi:Cu-Zn family superoxide dismutase
MKKISLIILVVIAVFLACKGKQHSANAKVLSVFFEAKSNSGVSGTATFTEKKGVVTMLANMSGLKTGVHAIHIHEKSDCSATDGSSAGGHWNPTFKKHGKWGIEEYHKGDIGNFTADEAGNATVTFSTDEWCIGCGDPAKDILGKGLIVHQGADDFTTQPTGNAGGRVACSGLIK